MLTVNEGMPSLQSTEGLLTDSEKISHHRSTEKYCLHHPLKASAAVVHSDHIFTHPVPFTVSFPFRFLARVGNRLYRRGSTKVVLLGCFDVFRSSDYYLMFCQIIPTQSLSH